jgi:hypothetical protein
VQRNADNRRSLDEQFTELSALLLATGESAEVGVSAGAGRLREKHEERS